MYVCMYVNCIYYLVDDDGDWLASVDGDRTPLPVVLACPLSVDLRVADVEEGVLPGVSLGMRLGVVESKTQRIYTFYLKINVFYFILSYIPMTCIIKFLIK